MKIAIISDIHSNPTALMKVLKDAEERKCERIVCLGDIVGYGYDPNTCIDIVRERKIECFLGNHDAAIVGKMSLDWFNDFAKNAIVRQRPLVTEENKKWLESLPYCKIEGQEDSFGYAFSHGTFYKPENFDYIQGYSDAVLESLYLKENKVSVLFVGHTHHANVYSFDSTGDLNATYIDIEDEDCHDLSKNDVSIVNVGSCGHPRNQPYSIYGIYDTATHEFYQRILPYDVDDNAASEQKCGGRVDV